MTIFLTKFLTPENFFYHNWRKSEKITQFFFRILTGVFSRFLFSIFHIFFRLFFFTNALKNSAIEWRKFENFWKFWKNFFSRNRNFFGLISSLESVYNACKVSSNLVKWFRRNRYRTHTHTPDKRFLLLGLQLNWETPWKGSKSPQNSCSSTPVILVLFMQLFNRSSLLSSRSSSSSFLGIKFHPPSYHKASRIMKNHKREFTLSY